METEMELALALRWSWRGSGERGGRRIGEGGDGAA